MPIDANESDLRKTGIAVVGDMPWGTHFCHFYETKEDLLSTLVPYFKTGLENNEFCLWVISDSLTGVEATAALRQAVPELERYLAKRSIEIQSVPEALTREEATGALRQAVPNLERHLAGQNIEIIPHHKWYLAGDAFDPQQVINSWKKKLDEALSRGHDGIRVTGNVGWLTERDWKNFLEYERGLSEAIANERMIVLCTYPLAVRAAAEVFNVGQAHDFAIARRHGTWEVFETPEAKQAKAELTALKDELNHRVNDRTSQLATANENLKTEIAQRKRTEEELRASERKFHNLVDLIPAAVYACDESGRITYYNRRAVELWGREPVPGHNAERYCASLRLYDLDGKLVRHDHTLMADALRTGESHLNKEVIIERPDQSRITVLVSIVPIRNEKNEVAGAINCFQDITDRKNTEAALKRAFQQIQALKDQLQKENLVLKEEIDRSSMFEEIVGRSPALRAVLARVAKVAPADSTVLITGETGTGKELIARAIHKRSRRSSRPFVTVNCAAIPASLIASELFGHEKGAFTGAVQRRLGRFELAEGGTIFLDEVGDLPAETQIALLHVLQEREFERVGGHQTIRSDVRIIAATHRDLSAAIDAGAFRSDLFYRLNVFPIEIPPLRKRREDIQSLVEYFIDRYARKSGKKIRSVNKKALQLLKSYTWPGNIRELQNVIERSVIVSDSEELFVDESWLSPGALRTQAARDTLSKKPHSQIKRMIEAALAETRGRVSGPSGAAAKLGIPPSTLESKIQALKINKRRFKIVYRSKTR